MKEENVNDGGCHLHKTIVRHRLKSVSLRFFAESHQKRYESKVCDKDMEEALLREGNAYEECAKAIETVIRDFDL